MSSIINEPIFGKPQGTTMENNQFAQMTPEQQMQAYHQMMAQQAQQGNH